VGATGTFALQHPVLPRCFGAATDGDRAHIVLEFLEGPRLSTLIRKQGSLAIEQAMPLAIQLCAALHLMAHEGAPRREAEERRDGCAAAADRPQHRDEDRTSASPDEADRDRRVHGPGAVWRRWDGRDLARHRRLGRRGDGG
jgi:hypothetical protein